MSHNLLKISDFFALSSCIYVRSLVSLLNYILIEYKNHYTNLDWHHEIH